MLLSLQASCHLLEFLCSFGTCIWCIALMLGLKVPTDILLLHHGNIVIANQTDTLSVDFFEEIFIFPLCLKSSALTCYLAFLRRCHFWWLVLNVFLYLILFSGEAPFPWLAPSSVETEKCNRVELKRHVWAIFNYIFRICCGPIKTFIVVIIVVWTPLSYIDSKPFHTFPYFVKTCQSFWALQLWFQICPEKHC